jgi:hypothetical protein
LAMLYAYFCALRLFVCLSSGDKEVMSSNTWNMIFVCEGNLYPSQTTPSGNLVH